MASVIEPHQSQAPYKQPQVAIAGDRVALTWGAGNAVYFAESADGGRTFSDPVLVAEAGVISLGNHRGPRIAITPAAIVITAIYGSKGKGADGDVLAFRSTDRGRTWSKGARVNDKAAAAREGLHAMAADGNFMYVSWLDDRDGGKELYGAASADGGATWTPNTRIYKSADGHICECCHPSLAVHGNQIHAMFRNWLGGSRDLYLATSKDGGKTWEARKLGEGTWPLNACPMDGGGLIVDDRGPLTVWRRASTVYMVRAGNKEVEVGPGKNPTIAGHTVVWSASDGLRMMREGSSQSSVLDATGAFPVGAADGNREIVAWEANGRILVKPIPATVR